MKLLVPLWATTPEREGNGITERVSFAISSQKWQKLYEEKVVEKKRFVEDEKDNRGKKLENKQAKKSKGPKKNFKKCCGRYFLIVCCMLNILYEIVVKAIDTLRKHRGLIILD